MATKKKTSTRTAKVARPKAAGSAKGTARKTAKKRNPQNIAIFALVAALVFMSIGFAAFAETLYINGNVTVKPANWDIHWASPSDTGAQVAQQTSASAATGATGTVTRVDGTHITFDATLFEPGDYYEFEVDAVNGGTFNATLTSVTLSSISAYENYLTYTVSYDGNTFTPAVSTPSSTSTLDAGAHKKATVKVEYIQPAQSSDLPQSDVTVSLSANFLYDQAN
jgi:hypothetical protein